jgi:hypothetical protein
MIDNIRNTVLAVINKNSYGYIPPNDFNVIIKMVQLGIYRDIKSRYNDIILRQVTRKSGSDNANELKILEDTLAIFKVNELLTASSGSTFDFPTSTEYDYTNKLWYKNEDDKYIEIEVVDRGRVNMLLNSTTLSVSKTFPICVINSSDITVYPTTIIGDVYLEYYRTPKPPKWTYVSLSGGEPIFDSTASDYQDIELPLQYEEEIIMGVLAMCGISIREYEIYKMTNTEKQFEYYNKMQQ